MREYFDGTATLFNGDCLEVMADAPDASVDLTVTSPPYDNLRTYNDSLNDWNPAKWQAIIKELYRLTKPGGVVVWVVGDATVKGSETGTSFRQVLHAMECGFRLHDTMIWNKGKFSSPCFNRYHNCFEYMFVFSKGQPNTFNGLMDRVNKAPGRVGGASRRAPDGSMKKQPQKVSGEYGKRFNIWDICPDQSQSANHPAAFPESLAADHIASWSNAGDVVLDPFLGSGTTGKMARILGRQFIGIERDEKYFDIAVSRISGHANDNNAPAVDAVAA
jgi:site-specific DNA-methyltransferase (adenine-specific)